MSTHLGIQTKRQHVRRKEQSISIVRNVVVEYISVQFQRKVIVIATGQ